MNIRGFKVFGLGRCQNSEENPQFFTTLLLSSQKCVMLGFQMWYNI